MEKVLNMIAKGTIETRWTEPGRIPIAYIDKRELKGLVNHKFVMVEDEMACITQNGLNYLERKGIGNE